MPQQKIISQPIEHKFIHLAPRQCSHAEQANGLKIAIASFINLFVKEWPSSNCE